MDLKSVIRDIPDFPKPGILFKDISPLLGDPEALQYCCEQMAAPFKMPGNEVDAVAAAEARGFIFIPYNPYKGDFVKSLQLPVTKSPVPNLVT